MYEASYKVIFSSVAIFNASKPFSFSGFFSLLKTSSKGSNNIFASSEFIFYVHELVSKQRFDFIKGEV